MIHAQQRTGKMCGDIFRIKAGNQRDKHEKKYTNLCVPFIKTTETRKNLKTNPNKDTFLENVDDEK